MAGYRVAVIPGDGVGLEVATEAKRVLDTAASRFGFDLETESFTWGCDWYLDRGEMMPEDALSTLAGFDAIFLGCIGDANKVPDDVSLTMLLEIRKGFDQYVNLRPIRLYPGVPTPITTATPETIDMVVVHRGRVLTARRLLQDRYARRIRTPDGRVHAEGLRAGDPIRLRRCPLAPEARLV
jgi:tartrate dehydrogenase/decarboxylase/D-malate dehydrogenase